MEYRLIGWLLWLVTESRKFYQEGGFATIFVLQQLVMPRLRWFWISGKISDCLIKNGRGPRGTRGKWL